MSQQDHVSIDKAQSNQFLGRAYLHTHTIISPNKKTFAASQLRRPTHRHHLSDLAVIVSHRSSPCLMLDLVSDLS
ncbi:hypothetical protein QVD17_40789 [Tagetes erecta]|uniref:Uncharacterized protein n=1 Tax=Tagetes erecta TaxID=13708 RepID=A0AAD8JQA7_TARER|nr:hypothetical protein QVD17_40789 [Tagetes erecta]